MNGLSYWCVRRNRNVPNGGMKVTNTASTRTVWGSACPLGRARVTIGNGSKRFARETGPAAPLLEDDLEPEQRRRVKALCDVLNAHDVEYVFFGLAEILNPSMPKVRPQVRFEGSAAVGRSGVPGEG